MKQTTLTEKRFFDWIEDDISVALRYKSGSYGGGQKYWLLYQQVIGTLCAADSKMIGNQYVERDKLIIEIDWDDS